MVISKSYTIRLIRRLPKSIEFVIVVLVAFGYFVRNSVFWLVQHVQSPVAADDLWKGSPSAITADHLSFLNLYEPVVFVALLWFLYVRGWTVLRLGAGPLRFSDAIVGVILAVVPILVFLSVAFVVSLVMPETLVAVAETADFTDHVPLPTVLLNSVINPIYEETFVCGYVISALNARTRPWLALGVSIIIRVLYHLYMSTLGIVNTALVGLAFALWYVWKSRLWPLIIAHSILDFVALI